MENLVKWKIAKNKIHDASGIDKPEDWLWVKDFQINVYYPYSKK